MPWWGILICVVVGLIVLYYTVGFIAALWVGNKARKVINRNHDELFGTARFKADPFDDPFFKDPFGRGQVRKPHDRYL